VHFTQSKLNIDLWQTLTLLAPPTKHCRRTSGTNAEIVKDQELHFDKAPGAADFSFRAASF